MTDLLTPNIPETLVLTGMRLYLLMMLRLRHVPSLIMALVPY